MVIKLPSGDSQKSKFGRVPSAAGYQQARLRQKRIKIRKKKDGIKKKKCGKDYELQKIVSSSELPRKDWDASFNLAGVKNT